MTTTDERRRINKRTLKYAGGTLLVFALIGSCLPEQPSPAAPVVVAAPTPTATPGRTPVSVKSRYALVTCEGVGLSTVGRHGDSRLGTERCGPRPVVVAETSAAAPPSVGSCTTCKKVAKKAGKKAGKKIKKRWW